MFLFLVSLVALRSRLSPVFLSDPSSPHSFSRHFQTRSTITLPCNGSFPLFSTSGAWQITVSSTMKQFSMCGPNPPSTLPWLFHLLPVPYEQVPKPSPGLLSQVCIWLLCPPTWKEHLSAFTSPLRESSNSSRPYFLFLIWLKAKMGAIKGPIPAS